MNHVIPKREVAVRIRMDTGECRAGDMFLDFIDVIHRGEQTLLDKVNDDSRWFPLRGESGEIHIVNRDRVLLVEPGPTVAPELVRKDSGETFRRETVAVCLPEGFEDLEGRIAMDLPDEFCRVSDFLNFPADFFPLETEDGPVLIAKRHVLALRAMEPPPSVPGLKDLSVGESG